MHERFTEFAGSEQVVAQLAQVWPQAEVFAPVVRQSALPEILRPRVRGTALSRLLRGGSSGGYAHLLPALPVAMRRLPVGRPDVLVASHHAFAAQAVYATSAPVLAYVHSPARWVWDPAMRAGEVGGALGAAGLRAFAAGYRPVDRRAAARLARIVANSTAVADRIRRWWEQPATVIHPPVDTEYYVPDPATPREDFLLLAGRLVPYKQPMLAIRAAAAAGVRLVVAGEGRSRAECEALAGPHTTFLGRVTDEELRSLYRRCAALLMPGVEDFGIVPVEAQACGAPVVATGAGGALDYVMPGLTGELVPPRDDGLRDDGLRDDGLGDGGLLDRWTGALRALDPARYDARLIRTHAEGFSTEVFRSRIRQAVESL